MNFDVSIIGAGIVGLATAFKLLAHNPRLSLFYKKMAPAYGKSLKISNNEKLTYRFGK